MANILARTLLLAMATIFGLLAYQAEPITAGIGYFFAVLLILSFFASFRKVQKRD